MASWGRHPRGEDLDLLWDFGTPIPMSVRDSSLATGSPSKEPKDESCCGVVNENVCGPQCISLVACTQLGITTDKAKGAWVAFFLLFFDIWKVQIFTSAILLCRLLVFDPRVCNCSNLFWSSSIWSLALAFCTLSWAFWSSNSRSLLVTQSLMRAALASTAFASARRKAL